MATLTTGGSLGLFILLKGFSSGAVALTGVEAISNGVPAFRKPKSKNAATTIVSDGQYFLAPSSGGWRVTGYKVLRKDHAKSSPNAGATPSPGATASAGATP